MSKIDKVIQLLESINEKLDSGKPKQKKVKASDQITSIIWEEYKHSFIDRWRVTPERNALINASIKNISNRIPKEFHKDLVRFFIQQNDSWYLREMHHIRCLQKDCEMLLTRMKSGAVITHGKARMMENASDNLNEAQIYLQNKRNENAK